ncbi:MAG: hypothetical protein R2809_10070 [Flavobacteriales bacterium]
MKSKISIFIAAFAFGAMAILSSCQQEEFDNTVVVTDPALVDTTTTTDPNSCSGVLTFNGGPAPITSSASAYIFNDNCTTTPFQDSTGITFVSIMADSYDWGSNGPNVGLALTGNGIPGIEFYGMAPLETGVQYYSVGNFNSISLFSYVGGGVSIVYAYELAYITLTEAGSEVGENMAGTITFYNWNPAINEYETSESSFCVPIAEVCE